MEGIGKLRTVFSIVRSLISVEPKNSFNARLWDILKSHAIIAIKKDPRNHPEELGLRSVLAHPWIEEKHIFPTEVPESWYGAGAVESLDATKLNSIVRIENTGDKNSIGYYVFSGYHKAPFFAARRMAS